MDDDTRMLAEVAEALADAELASTDTTIVMLRCPSGFAGEVINQRYLRKPCNGKRCKIPGTHTDHLFDMQSGRFTTIQGDVRNMGAKALGGTE